MSESMPDIQNSAHHTVSSTYVVAVVTHPVTQASTQEPSWIPPSSQEHWPSAEVDSVCSSPQPAVCHVLLGRLQ